jgi:hypothetical protein
MATSNYGSTWTFNSESYKCIVTGFPEISTDEIDTTNHSSGAYAEAIPSGLIRVGNFTLELLEESGNLLALRNHVASKTVATSIIENNLTTLTGSSFIKSVAVGEADAQSPDANKVTVVVACTGTWTPS